MTRILSIAAAAVVLLAAPADAQQRRDNLTGTRVRVTAPNFLDSRITGTVTSFTHERLVVREESTSRQYTLPLKGVSRLDPYKGGSPRSTAWYRGRLGAFIGGSIGALLAPALVKVSDGSLGSVMVVSGAAGVVTGATVGAVHGWRNPTERWGWVIEPWGYDPELGASN